ncbi:MAG: translation initiation factor IF-3 [Terriglobia bacterium]
MNERIRAREIRVVDEEGGQLGIMPPFEALKLARERGVDLVEVSPTANPPVCRVMNYGKYLYQLNKRQHEARKHQKSIELKEVKFRPRTSEHDFAFKRDHVIEFLKEGSKVKATIMFRGREMAHRNLGWQMLERLVKEVGEAGQLEARPRQEGPNLTVIIAAKKPSGKAQKPAGQVKVPAPKPQATGAAVAAPGTKPAAGQAASASHAPAAKSAPGTKPPAGQPASVSRAPAVKPVAPGEPVGG